jgi:ribosomal 50S subunit-recycling heat shock protein
MALDKEIAQGIIDDFVFSNDNELNRISGENKALFNATVNALDFLSKKFGTGQKIQIIEKPNVESDIFKVGDKFKINNEDRKEAYEVIDISGDRFSFKNADGTVYSDLYTTTEANKKIKDGKWIKVADLPFKEGDKFYIGVRGKKNVYTIIKIIFNDINEVTIKDSDNNSFQYSIEEVKKAFGYGTWIKIEGLPFKVGDKIYNKNTPNNIHTIYKIDEETDFFQFETSDGRKLQGSLKDTIKDVESGELIVIKEKDLPFKVGDKFNFKTKGGYANNVILEIDPNKDYFEFENEHGSKLNGWTLKEAKQNFESGEWILVKDITLKVGDTFVVNNGKDGNRIIKNIDESPDRIYVFTTLSNKELQLELDYIEDNIKAGIWVKLEDIPFAIGDSFTVSQTKNNFTIDFINATEVGLTYEDGLTSLIDIDRFKDGLKSGYYIPIEETKIEVGDLLLSTNKKEVFEIKSINQAGTVVKLDSGKDKGVTSSELAVKLSIETGDRIKLPFKIGDKFENKSKEIVTIDGLHQDFTDTIYISIDGSPTTAEVDSLTQEIKDGTLKLISSKNTSASSSINVQSGDYVVFTKNDEIREVEEVDNKQEMINFVKTNPNGAVKYTPFYDFNFMINSGLCKKLPFKKGDTFVNKYGDTSTIEGLYERGDGYVKVIHDNGIKETYDYKKIVKSIEDGSWTKISGTVKTQKIPAPQVVTASNTAPISAKPAKKTLSKEEKAIKMLQKEIDGLEIIAEFDDEAKEELEKKQAEIKALKSKIS